MQFTCASLSGDAIFGYCRQRAMWMLCKTIIITAWLTVLLRRQASARILNRHSRTA